MCGQEVTWDEIGEDESEKGRFLVSDATCERYGMVPNSLFLCASRWHMLRAFVRFSSAWKAPRISSGAINERIRCGKLIPERNFHPGKG